MVRTEQKYGRRGIQGITEKDSNYYGLYFRKEEYGIIDRGGVHIGGYGFDEDLWYSLIEYVMVFIKEYICFIFKDGKKIRV